MASPFAHLYAAGTDPRTPNAQRKLSPVGAALLKQTGPSSDPRIQEAEKMASKSSTSTSATGEEEVLTPKRQTHFKLPDGSLKPIVAPSGERYVVKNSGWRHPRDPKTNEPVLINEKGESRSIYDDAPRIKKDGKIYAAPAGYEKKEIGIDPDFNPNAATPEQEKANAAKQKEDEKTAKEQDAYAKAVLERDVAQIITESEVKSQETAAAERMAKLAEAEITNKRQFAKELLTKAEQDAEDRKIGSAEALAKAQEEYSAARKSEEQAKAATKAIEARQIQEDLANAKQKVTLNQFESALKLENTGRRQSLTMPTPAKTKEPTARETAPTTTPVSALPTGKGIDKAIAASKDPDIRYTSDEPIAHPMMVNGKLEKPLRLAPGAKALAEDFQFPTSNTSGFTKRAGEEAGKFVSTEAPSSRLDNIKANLPDDNYSTNTPRGPVLTPDVAGGAPETDADGFTHRSVDLTDPRSSPWSATRSLIIKADENFGDEQQMEWDATHEWIDPQGNKRTGGFRSQGESDNVPGADLTQETEFGAPDARGRRMGTNIEVRASKARGKKMAEGFDADVPPEWTSSNALTAQATARDTGTDVIHTDKELTVELPASKLNAEGSLKVADKKVGVIRRTMLGLPEIELAPAAFGQTSSPSYRSSDPFKGAPEYAAPSASYLEQQAKEGIPAEAQKQWREQRWGDKQVAEFIENWNGFGDAERRKMMDSDLLKDMEGEMPNARDLFLAGRISLQQARQIDQAVYGRSQKLPGYTESFTAWRGGNSPAAAKLRNLESAGFTGASTRELELAKQRVLTEWEGEYRRRHGNQPDFDPNALVSARKFIAGKESTGWQTFISDTEDLGSTVAGSLAGIGHMGLKMGMANATYGMADNAVIAMSPMIPEATQAAIRDKQAAGAALTDQEKGLLFRMNYTGGKNVPDSALATIAFPKEMELAFKKLGSDIKALGSKWKDHDENPAWKPVIPQGARVAGGGISMGGGFASQSDKDAAIKAYLEKRGKGEGNVLADIDLLKEHIDNNTLTPDTLKVISDRIKAKALKNVGMIDKSQGDQITQKGQMEADKSNRYDLMQHSNAAALMAGYQETRDESYIEMLKDLMYSTAEREELIMEAGRHASMEGLIQPSDSWGAFNLTRRGIQTDLKEGAIEAAGTALSFGLSKALNPATRIFKAAGKAGTAATRMQQTLAAVDRGLFMLQKSKTLAAMKEMGEAYGKVGLRANAPILNRIIQTGKEIPLQMAGEGVQGFSAAMFEEGKSGKELLHAAALESMGGFIATAQNIPLVAGAGAIERMKMNAANQKHAQAWADNWNAKHPEQPITAGDAMGVHSLIDQRDLAQARTAAQTAISKLDAYLDENQGPPPAELSQPVVNAMWDIHGIEQVGIQTYQELEGIGDKRMKAFVKAGLRTLTGQPLTTEDQKALGAVNAAGEPLITMVKGQVVFTEAGLAEVSQAADGIRGRYFPPSQEAQEQAINAEAELAATPPPLPAEPAPTEAEQAPSQSPWERLSSLQDGVKTPAEWAKDAGFQILSADGWRGKDSKDFDEPISKDEFLKRFNASTVKPLQQSPAASPAEPTLATSDQPTSGDGGTSVVDEQAKQAATSPTNNLPEPTEAQKKAGNYKVGKINISGLNISIENPQGSVRKGKDEDGKSWEVQMSAHYGYMRGTVGADGDQIDVFIKPGTPEDFDGMAFVIPQRKPDGSFDEHKVMIGYTSIEEAKAAYKAHYAKGWKGYRPAMPVPMSKLAEMVKNGSLKKPNQRQRTNTNEQPSTQPTGPVGPTPSTDASGGVPAPTPGVGETNDTTGPSDSTVNPDAGTEVGEGSVPGVEKTAAVWSIRTTKGRKLTIPASAASTTLEARAIFSKMLAAEKRPLFGAREMLVLGNGSEVAPLAEATIEQQVFDIVSDLVRKTPARDKQLVMHLGRLVIAGIHKHQKMLGIAFSDIEITDRAMEGGGMEVLNNTLIISPSTLIRSMRSFPPKYIETFVDTGFFHEALHPIIGKFVSPAKAAYFWNALTQEAQDAFKMSYEQGNEGSIIKGKNADVQWGYEYLRALIEKKYNARTSEELFVHAGVRAEIVAAIKKVVAFLLDIQKSLKEGVDHDLIKEITDSAEQAIIESGITTGNVDAQRNATSGKAKAEPIGSSARARAMINEEFGAMAKSLGIDIIPNYTGPSAHYVISEDGKRRGGYIEINPVKVAGWSRGQMMEAMREEMIHAIEDRALIAEMMKAGYKMSDPYIQSGDYHVDFFKGVYEMMSPEQIAYVKDIYTSHGNREYVIGSEFRRMLLQNEHYKGLTEAAMAGGKNSAKAKKAIAAIASLLKTAVKYLRALATTNTPAGKQAARIYEESRKMLQKLDPRGEAKPLAMAAPSLPESAAEFADISKPFVPPISDGLGSWSPKSLVFFQEASDRKNVMAHVDQDTFISFRPRLKGDTNPSIPLNGETAIKTGDGKYHILNGDHRSAYKEAYAKGGKDGVMAYYRLSSQKSLWSNDNKLGNKKVIKSLLDEGYSAKDITQSMAAPQQPNGKAAGWNNGIAIKPQASNQMPVKDVRKMPEAPKQRMAAPGQEWADTWLKKPQHGYPAVTQDSNPIPAYLTQDGGKISVGAGYGYHDEVVDSRGLEDEIADSLPSNVLVGKTSAIKVVTTATAIQILDYGGGQFGLVSNGSISPSQKRLLTPYFNGHDSVAIDIVDDGGRVVESTVLDGSKYQYATQWIENHKSRMAESLRMAGPSSDLSQSATSRLTRQQKEIVANRIGSITGNAAVSGLAKLHHGDWMGVTEIASTNSLMKIAVSMGYRPEGRMQAMTFVRKEIARRILDQSKEQKTSDEDVTIRKPVDKQAAIATGFRQSMAAPRISGSSQVHPSLPSIHGSESQRMAGPLVGLPSKVKIPGIGEREFGPFQPARDTAVAYMQEAGLNYDPPRTYAKVDRSRAERIAAAFDAMKHEPQDPKVAAAYQALIDETVAQWEAIKKTGLKVSPMKKGMADPYAASPRLAQVDVEENNHLWFYPTDFGFGNDVTGFDPKDNPLFEFTGEVIDGHKMRANDVFRIVHDYFGHFKEGVGFRADGEENAWRQHAAMFSDLARGALTTETRGQNSWLNFGPFGEKNRTAKVEDTVFADQKIGLMPEWTWKEGLADPVSGGAAFAKFFNETQTTKDGGATFKDAKEILQRPLEGHEPELQSYLKFGSNFQKHIMASIPGFLDARIRVMRGMAEAAVVLGRGGKEVAMLDITSSEGYFTKAWAEQAQARGVNATADALDALPAFEDGFNATPQVKGVRYLLEAWGESFVDPTTKQRIPQFKANKKYAIVHEGMGFQFFTPTRDAEIAEVKSMMTPDGLFVTLEKLKNQDYKAREVLKDEYKAQFFSQKQMADKAATVLNKSDENAVGMSDYQFDRLAYEGLLKKHFKNVVQIYSSGNFAGYYATDADEVMRAAIENTGNTTTKFNEEQTPRVIAGVIGGIMTSPYAESAVRDLGKLSLEDEGGDTFNLDGTKYTGGGVAIPVLSKNVDDYKKLTTGDIGKFINPENIEYVAAGGSVLKAGIYKFPNSTKASIDLNIIAPRERRDEGVKIAGELGQESAFDLDTFENIKTGQDGMNPRKPTVDEVREIAQRLSMAAPQLDGELALGKRASASFLRQKNVKRVIDKTAAAHPEAKLVDYIKDGSLYRLDEKGLPQAHPEEYNLPESRLAKESMKGLRGDARPRAYERALADRLKGFYDQIKDQADVMAGKEWYRVARTKLVNVFGDDTMLFAQLLAATSARTPVQQNFEQALDAYNGIKDGRFDGVTERYLSAMQSMEAGELQFRKSIGNNKMGDVVTPKTFREWLDIEEIMPRRENGKKYNANSIQVLNVIAGVWREKLGGPKTAQFSDNLSGASLEATVDVWAARTLHRLSNEQEGARWRILPEAETGVNNEDFAIGQAAFRIAASELGMNPDDLQGVLWFAEKRHWAARGWTRAAGSELSDFSSLLDFVTDDGGRKVLRMNTAQGMLGLDDAATNNSDRKPQTRGLRAREAGAAQADARGAGSARQAAAGGRGAERVATEEQRSLFMAAPSPEQINDILPGAEYISPRDAFYEPIKGPVIIGAFHGTTHDFSRFTNDRGEPGNNFGKAIYATTSIDDVNANYAGVGPDLTNRISEEKERLLDQGKTKSWATRLAKKKLVGHGGAIVPLWIPSRNPLILDKAEGDTKIQLRVDRSEYHEDAVRAVMSDRGMTREEAEDSDYVYEEIDRLAEGDDQIDKIKGVIDSFDGTDWAKLVDDIGYENESIGASELENILRTSDGTIYAEDDDGNMVNGELVRQVFMDALGYDAIIDRNVADKFKSMKGMNASVHIIVDADGPNRPVSALSPTHQFMAGPNSDPQRANFVEPGFYSELQRTIASKMPNSMKAIPASVIPGRKTSERTITNPKTGQVIKVIKATNEPDRTVAAKGISEQMEAMLLNADVTPDELKWSGLLTWLDGRESVTKDEVEQYLRDEGQVRFVEYHNGLKPRTPAQLNEDSYNAMRERLGRANKLTPEAEKVLTDWLNADASNYDVEDITGLDPEDYTSSSPKGESKYASHVLPGGSNYREVVLSMPISERRDPYAIKTYGKPYGELDHAQKQAVRKATETMPDNYYVSSHFPDAPNYVAHMRLNERTDADGKRGLFIEELQSDRHQKGRKEGYGTSKNLEGLTTFPNPNFPHTRAGRNSWGVRYADGEVLGYFFANSSEAALEIARETAPTIGVPDAPFRQSSAWGLHLFKRALRDAVESGKEWIGWTVGDTQNERYGLEKHFNEIILQKPFSDGRIYIDGRDKNGRRIVDKIIQPNELADHVGEELAAKFDAMPWKPYKFEESNGAEVTHDSKLLKGLDLKTGGSGMRGFYDKIMPREIGDYVKQWGAKVEKSEVKSVGALPPIKVVPIWKIEITPQMRQSIANEGQALFMAGPRSESPEAAGEALEAWLALPATAAELQMLREQALSEEAGKRTVGDPARAGLLGSGDKENRERDAIIQFRKNHKAPEKVVDWMRDGQELADSDPDMVADALLDNFYNGVGYDTPEQVFASAIVVSRMFKEARQKGDSALLRKAQALAYADGAARSENARILRSMVDPHRTPEERMNEFFAKLISTPSEFQRIEIEKAPSPLAKEREIAELKAKIEELQKQVGTQTQGPVVEQKKKLEKTLDQVKQRKDRKTLVDEYTEARRKAVAAALKKEGLSEEDIFVSANERLGAQNSDPVQEAIAQHPEEHREAINYIMRGYSHKDIAQMTKLPVNVVATIHQEFRQKSMRSSLAKWVKKGNTLFDTIQNGLKKVFGMSMAAPIPLAQARAQIIAEQEIERQLNVLVPTAQQVNSGKMVAVIVNGKNGQDVTIKVPFSASDFRSSYRVGRAISTSESNAFDKIYEYWISFGLLSGPETHWANVMGNAGMLAVHLFAQKPLEAAINFMVRDPNSATFGEFGEMIKGILPGVRDAFALAALAWDAEADPIGARYMDETIDLKFDATGNLSKVGTMKGPAISGTKGRVFRVSTRFLLAMDAFFKAITANIEVGARAHRLGKMAQAKGTLGKAKGDLEAFIAQQVATPGSESWELAIETSKELAFQGDNWLTLIAGSLTARNQETAISRLTNDIVKASATGDQSKVFNAKFSRYAMMMTGFAMKFIFPFVKTPTNIIRTGARKAGLGAIGLLALAPYVMSKGVYNIARGRNFHENNQSALMVTWLAEQVQAAAMWMYLWSIAEGDDDDNEKPFYIVGSRPYGTAKPGEREEAYAKSGGTQVVMVRNDDGTYTPWAYGRYEPFATVLTSVVDTMREIKDANRLGRMGLPGGSWNNIMTNSIASFASQLQDKSFFQGFANVTKAFEKVMNKKSGELATDTIKGFLQGFVPNIVRQPLRNTDPIVRDSKKADAAYLALPMGRFAEPLLDFYGRESEKQGNSVSRLLIREASKPQDNTKAEEMIDRWNLLHPDKKYQPSRISKTDMWIYGPNKERRIITDNKLKTEFERELGQEILRRHNELASGIEGFPDDFDDRLRNEATKAREQVRKDFLNKSFERQQKLLK